MSDETMVASRELDALVAERVMGWIDYDGLWEEAGRPGHWVHGPIGDFCPSTDIAAAWLVVEKLRDTHLFECEQAGHSVWACFLLFLAERPSMPDDGCYAETMPLAICLAALKAVGATEASDNDSAWREWYLAQPYCADAEIASRAIAIATGLIAVERLAAFEAGEYICQKCWLRHDAPKVDAGF